MNAPSKDVANTFNFQGTEKAMLIRYDRPRGNELSCSKFTSISQPEEIESYQ